MKLATNEVFINEHQESSGHNTESCYRRRVEPIAYDQMANAMVDGHKLIGKKVVAGLDDNDGTIKFSLHNYTIIDLKTGTFDFHYVDLATIIQTLKNIPAMEHVGHGIELMTQYYNPEMHTETWLAKIWWLVDYYNFYNMMDQYSNLLSYYKELYLDFDEPNFFKAAKILPDFKFRLTNAYLPEYDGYNAQAVARVRESSFLAKFYNQLDTECREALIEGALTEKYDIASLADLSYSGDEIAKYATENPEFFCDYIRGSKPSDGHGEILIMYRKDVELLKLHNLPLMFNNLKVLRWEQKAEALGCSLHDLFGLIGHLNTKEGILQYLKGTS